MFGVLEKKRRPKAYFSTNKIENLYLLTYRFTYIEVKSSSKICNLILDIISTISRSIRA